MKVSTPNRMAQIPRNRMSHQFLASACSMKRGAKGGCVFTEVATIVPHVAYYGIARAAQGGPVASARTLDEPCPPPYRRGTPCEPRRRVGRRQHPNTALPALKSVI